MKKDVILGIPRRGIIAFMIGFLVVFISAVSYHSVQEIHYLKSFFPRELTVEQAIQVANVEFVKV